jgi:hypothetical protein
VARALDLLDVALPDIKRWNGSERGLLRPKVIGRTANGISETQRKSE